MAPTAAQHRNLAHGSGHDKPAHLHIHSAQQGGARLSLVAGPLDDRVLAVLPSDHVVVEREPNRDPLESLRGGEKMLRLPKHLPHRCCRLLWVTPLALNLRHDPFVV
uniref:Uncharacterized protein n=1 Tax=Noctiluca scintillans TaxID=2966 RepID=A0A7S0ZYU8_NOCSC